MDTFLTLVNAILWHEFVLYIMVFTGLTFTIWSGFSQYRALTHGVGVIRGRYDDPDDPGAINHFQALSTALSATVGLGNIGGVAIAISLGGPGAIFWMWVIGFLGMATKLTEVTLSMLYRNTEDPGNPHGGPMYVISRGLPWRFPSIGFIGKALGGLFCITCLIMAATGGNMFQAWNVGTITEEYFKVPSIASGIMLAVIVGMVIIGGIKRIGAVTGRLVPIMVVLYLLAAFYVLVVNYAEIPGMFVLIFKGAFSTLDASGAFIGGTMGYAFLFGMKRAIFSNEAGQGTSPIAHSAAKTREPVREGIVAGLEPFVDTIVVCTLTALVILSTGVWQRGAEAVLLEEPQVQQTSEGDWTLAMSRVSERDGADPDDQRLRTVGDNNVPILQRLLVWRRLVIPRHGRHSSTGTSRPGILCPASSSSSGSFKILSSTVSIARAPAKPSCGRALASSMAQGSKLVHFSGLLGS